MIVWTSDTETSENTSTSTNCGGRRIEGPRREAAQETPPHEPGASENSSTRKRATHLNYVWSYDFVMDLTKEGRRLKMPVDDEYSRECLSIDVERSMTAEDVIETLATLFRRRGEPIFIRSDNGPEFSPKPSSVGWRPLESRLSTSNRDLPGRTPT